MPREYIPELLAPAGDMARLRYAIAYGADAVYAGQPAFSLRARENGFRNLDDLAEGIRYTHERGKKFYLTSNVIARNFKVEAFQKALLAAIELAPDALIVADPGIIGWLRKEAPQIPLHLSVQANTTNWLTAQFWAEQGVERIILSRELKLSEVFEIQRQVPETELEVFVHGAVCMAMSGRCMLSNWATHRDANQGMCNNSCRLPYRLYANAGVQDDRYREHQGNFSLVTTDPKSEMEAIALDEDSWGTYFMSSRDLCAIQSVRELVQNKIASFKLEGRTRSVYYLSQVVSAYRKAIDAAMLGKEPPESALKALLYTDNRGWMPGFKTGPLPQNYEATQVPAELGCVAAQIKSFHEETGTLEILVKNPITPEQEFEILTPEGMFPCTVSGLTNFKNESAEILHPGTGGSLRLQNLMPGVMRNAEFSFLTAKKKSKTSK